MLHIRIVKTKGNSRSVQVYHYQNSKRVIIKHIGSGTTNEEIFALEEMARLFIADYTKQLYLFEDSKPGEEAVLVSQCEFIGIYLTYLYDVLRAVQHQIGYTLEADALLNDFVVIRIVEPGSKLRSIELIESYFGIKHRRQQFYESAHKWLVLKERIEKKTLDFARKQYGFDFSLLFYDVTTLYFETFTEDELRKNGFSKDNKSQQPQIVVALMVTPEGFPVSYEVFSGNTFEGHTLIPVIKSFIKKHKVENFTVVADAAMISTENVEALRVEKINYIVGARLGNVSAHLLETIDAKLPKIDGSVIRLKTENGYLICSFSKKRYNKDKFEMNRQIERAKLMLTQPSKMKRVKYLKSGDSNMMLNEKLIEKTTKLLGIKGYYTDIKEAVADNATIISRYHDLYKVEQAFRVSKNDLQTRPIFHFKEEPIQLHILICFMALAISKHIEITATLSIRAFLTHCKKITDARLINKITKKEIRMRAHVPNHLQEIITKILRPH
ncbi:MULTISPECIES: IS1634 family transposase [Hydrotalea]|uniref:IS1634 family transposase n=1 Tax=Hydrotalea TaxID=1004300 RepID=UPI000944B717|nr:MULTISPECIES: IS1634 family transposase [Hydrotalea]RWZ83168.1 MAG: IS1634 family transposase [Hydrotalea sp. AMD]GHV58176.1 IS1634 family transposase [Deltaproteobacteria bacterium]GHV62162.1 IS1634 family transposase [Bacteroidia bacterium]